MMLYRINTVVLENTCQVRMVHDGVSLMMDTR